MLSWPAKDPSEVLDYSIDWTLRLDAAHTETIASSTWTVDEGDVQIGSNPAPSIAGSLTTLWLRGGTDDTACIVTNQIVTSAGRTYDTSARIRIRKSNGL